MTVTVLSEDTTVTLRVQDNGPGIPEDQREQVFRRFFRADNSRSIPGNGLGLSLVDAIARLHGFRLDLKDNDPGCRFELWADTIPSQQK